MAHPPLSPPLGTVRQLARSGDVKALLPLCDRLRDDVLAELGVSLRDEDGGPASWNLVDPGARQLRYHTHAQPA